MSADTPTLTADTPVSRCQFYRLVCGFPAVLQPEVGRIFVRAGRVGAITMPSPLGGAVKTLMQRRKTPVGPIISHTRANRWTFLVQPDVPGHPLFRELFGLNVAVAPPGAQILLPSPVDVRAGVRAWVQPPRSTLLPSGMVVVGIVRACLAARR